MEAHFAPYAPPSAVLNVIHHYKNRDVPERISSTNLMQIGVTEALTARTTAALRFLGLLREDGTTTEQFRALRYANDETYQEVLGQVLNSAYKDVLDHVDVKVATEREITNAFIPFSPGGQRDRMITLFLALAQEAGWSTAVQPKASSPRSRSSPTEPRSKSAKTPRKTVDNSRSTVEAKFASAPPQTTGTPSSTSLAFGITAEDMADLPDNEFDEVWTALGKLAKAKAKATKNRAPARDVLADLWDASDGTKAGV